MPLRISVIILLSGLMYMVLSAGMLELRVTVGPNYIQSHQAGKYTLRPRPQMAFWLEDTRGAYIADIFITRKTGKCAWIIGETSRLPYVLPVWSHKKGVRYADGSYLPDSASPLPDAVTGATPTESFAVKWIIPDNLKPGVYLVRAEINNSFDYNDTYAAGLPDDNRNFNQFNGQPSLVLQGALQIGRIRGSILLRPLGCGDLLGRDGGIVPGTRSLTTALRIIDTVRVTFIPENRQE